MSNGVEELGWGIKKEVVMYGSDYFLFLTKKKANDGKKMLILEVG